MSADGGHDGPPQPVRPVIVGVDGSAAADSAVDWALAEAEATGRPLEALTAWALPVLPGNPGLVPPDLLAPALLEASARHTADDALARARERRTSSNPAQARVAYGSAGPVLVDAAADAALLVVGEQGKGRVERALLGSAASYVVHHAPCPVAVVPARTAPLPPHRVVVGVDGSPGARSALLWGVAAAQRYDCPLHATYSWMTNSAMPQPPMEFMRDRDTYRAEAQAWLDHELGEALPDGHGVEVHRRLMHSTPAWGLLEATRPQDLLVLGTRGRGGFARLLLGSVSSQCIRHASGTVVVVPAGQERLSP